MAHIQLLIHCCATLFVGIDTEFKDLMKNAINTPGVPDAARVEGRLDLLKGLTARLELCQKSLNGTVLSSPFCSLRLPF